MKRLRMRRNEMREIGITRRGILSAGVLALAVGLGACNSGGSNSDRNPAPAPPGPGKPANAGAKGHQIVFIFKSVGQYSEACKKGAEQANGELTSSGGKVTYLAPDTADVGKQISIIEQQIANKVDAVVISPNNADAVVPILKKA